MAMLFDKASEIETQVHMHSDLKSWTLTSRIAGQTVHITVIDAT